MDRIYKMGSQQRTLTSIGFGAKSSPRSITDQSVVIPAKAGIQKRMAFANPLTGGILMARDWIPDQVGNDIVRYALGLRMLPLTVYNIV